MKIHPNEQTLEEFLLSLDDRQRSVVRHLGWCGPCRSKLVYLPRPQPPEQVAPAGQESDAFGESRRVVSEWQAAMEKERDDAPGLFVELLGQPAGDRERFLDEQARFQTWGVFELLVERSLEASIQDPEFGEHLGLLALGLADHLDRERYGAERITDLRARAWAFMGNACRLCFDFQGAEEAFDRSYSLLKKGTRDGLERAIYLDLKASLRRAQRRFDEALRLLERAVEIFLGYGEKHRAGRSLMNISIVHYHAGDVEAAIPVLRQSLPLLDPEREPRVVLCAHHNLIFYLAELGRSVEAQRLYRETRNLYRSFNEPWVQNRRKWVRGKIAKGLGQPGQAEVQLTAARDGFLAEGIPYDTALVSLELAHLYAEQGRTEDLKRISAEMLPIFASRNIHREALAALAFFQKAVETEKATAELVAKVAAYLRRAEADPELRFEASKGDLP